MVRDRSIHFIWVFIFAYTAAAFAQTPPSGGKASPQPSFEVVLIRALKGDDNPPTHITNSHRNGYFRAVNVNLKALLEVAYGVPDLRMFGGPGWITTEKFSLEAKAAPEFDEQIASLPIEQAKQLKRKMLTKLLAERFKVAVHTEQREMPVYAIVVAKGGSKIDKSKVNDNHLPSGNVSLHIRPGSDALEILAYELSWRLGRPVLDRTGLRPQQEIVLQWQNEDRPAAESNGPSMLTALQEQLGLRLESAKAAVTVLVIDRAERPTEN